MKLKKFGDWKVVHRVLDLLKQGITPEKIALCAALGISIAIFPVLGSTTLLCTLAAFIFKVNLPLIQLVNYLAYPLQLLLILPFIRAGEFLFRETPITLSVPQMLQMIRQDILGTIRSLWIVTLHAMAVWLFIGPLITVILTLILTPVIRKLGVKR